MMNEEHKKPDLQQESLHQHPFRVPEGYFDSFPDRLKDRISQLEAEEVPVRKLGGSVRFRIAMAAAVVCLALVSYPVIRIATTLHGETQSYPDIALLEEAGIFYNDYELAGYLDVEASPMDDEEAYLDQAVEYLAMNDVEMDLLFE